MNRIEGNGVRLVLIEDVSRFARDLLTQELGILALTARGISVVTASGENLSQTGDPTKKVMRQMAGAFAEYEKSRLVQKLRAARERKRAEKGHCEGRKPVPAAVSGSARRHAIPGRSLRAIAALLAADGHLAPSGRVYGPESVKRMLAR